MNSWFFSLFATGGKKKRLWNNILWLLGLFLVAGAGAVPRVGTHATFTRLVFNLPAVSPAQLSVSGSQVTVSLKVKMPTEKGVLSEGSVKFYAVSGSTVRLTLVTGAGRPTISVLAAEGSQKPRLVIDVPKGVAQVTSHTTSGPIAGRPRLRVVLDAGHGGIDPGMSSKWMVEKAVTLDIAKRTKAVLLKHGVAVVMVRETDTQLSTNKEQDLYARSRLGTTGTVSAYVSIHVNAASSSAQGIETYYFGNPLSGKNRSLAIRENGSGSIGQQLTRRAAKTAQDMLGDILAQAKLAFSRQLATQVQRQIIASTGAVSRGVQADAFYVIRNPTTPAILVEVGFGTHPVEGRKLATPAYREKLAQALARAILDFLHTK